MTELKTDFKDDIVENSEERKYKVVENEDGTISLLDVTSYQQIGDTFSAKNINETNICINKLNHVAEVTLSSSGWVSSSGIYTQTANLAAVTAEDNPILVSMLADGASASTQKSYNKAFGIITSGTGTTYDGYVIFKVYKKPEISITVGLKGV